MRDDGIGAWRHKMLTQQIELKASINDLSVVIAAVTLIYCVSLYSIALSILLAAGLLGFCVWTSWANQRDADVHEASSWDEPRSARQPNANVLHGALDDTIVPLRPDPAPTQLDVANEPPARRYTTPRRSPPIDGGDRAWPAPDRRPPEAASEPAHGAPPPVGAASTPAPVLPAPSAPAGQPSAAQSPTPATVSPAASIATIAPRPAVPSPDMSAPLAAAQMTSAQPASDDVWTNDGALEPAPPEADLPRASAVEEGEPEPLTRLVDSSRPRP